MAAANSSQISGPLLELDFDRLINDADAVLQAMMQPRTDVSDWLNRAEAFIKGIFDGTVSPDAPFPEVPRAAECMSAAADARNLEAFARPRSILHANSTNGKRGTQVGARKSANLKIKLSLATVDKALRRSSRIAKKVMETIPRHSGAEVVCASDGDDPSMGRGKSARLSSSPKKLPLMVLAEESPVVVLEDDGAKFPPSSEDVDDGNDKENVDQNGRCASADSSDEYTDVEDCANSDMECSTPLMRPPATKQSISTWKKKKLSNSKRKLSGSIVSGLTGFTSNRTPMGSLCKSNIQTPVNSRKRVLRDVGFGSGSKTLTAGNRRKAPGHHRTQSETSKLTASAVRSQAKLLEELQKKEQRDREIRKEREQQLKAKLEEQKRKRDLRMQQAAEARKKNELEKVHRTRNFEKRHLEQAAENKRKLEEQRQEEIQKKQMLKKGKALEIEQKKTEEKLRLAKIIEEKALRSVPTENLQQKAVLNSTFTQFKAEITGDPQNTDPATTTNKIVHEAPGNVANSTFVLDRASSTSSYDLTPPPVPQKPSTPPPCYENYDINDFRSDESDDEENPRKPIPNWAKGVALKSSIICQRRNPPDLDELFGLIPIPDLEAILGTGKPYLRKRTSSAVWESTPPRVKRHQ